MTDDKTATIRDLNDRFRSGDQSVPGRTLITSGVYSLLEDTETQVNQLLVVVREFSEFCEDVESRWCALPHC